MPRKGGKYFAQVSELPQANPNRLSKRLGLHHSSTSDTRSTSRSTHPGSHGSPLSGSAPSTTFRNEFTPTFLLQSCSPVPYLDNGVASGRCLDGPSASLGLVVRPVVRLGLHLDPQLVGARLAGQRPLEGWERLDGQTGQRETTPAETL